MEVIELIPENKAFPKRLLELFKAKCPSKLYCIGNLGLLQKDGLGFCGSRKASEKGLQVAKDCAEQASKNGIVVISGNAAGVDFETHYSALENGGDTILILPEGINNFSIKKGLKEVWDWQRTLVISQFNPDAPWRSYQAMERNKLIIGLSKSIIVIEAGESGGTLNAGQETLKIQMPLFVADYGDLDIALGNKILLNRGAHRLAKNPITMKANMERVFDEISKDEAIKLARSQQDLF